MVMKMKMQPEMLSLYVKMKFEKMFCSRKPWRCKQGPYKSLDVFSLPPTAAVSKSLWMFLRSRVLCWAHGHHHPCPHQSPVREALLHGPVLQGWCQRGPQHAPIAGAPISARHSGTTARSLGLVTTLPPWGIVQLEPEDLGSTPSGDYCLVLLGCWGGLTERMRRQGLYAVRGIMQTL